MLMFPLIFLAGAELHWSNDQQKWNLKTCKQWRVLLDVSFLGYMSLVLFMWYVLLIFVWIQQTYQDIQFVL